ncbi:MAG: DUF1080 domain-containing protein [Kiritimatiellae bacterium]|nr:DUF1080 domain-containing protein [Kiritimatiellia bacterium]MDD5522372.1 DUF1080 domain-containing protein [Kiritimatiellia bacterium]
MKTKITCSCMAILCVLSIPVFAADEAKAPAAGQRVALFDGKTLDGWDIIKCEAVVEDGSILIKAGNGVVQTKKKYSDFIIEFEWKALKVDKWDSGVYFRYESIPENKPWPNRYQANLRKGDEGNVGGLKNAKGQGLFKNGEWNSFKMTVRGTTAEMEMNGKPSWKADGLEGPKEGFICLQAEVPGGGQCLFRNIYITELK